MGVRFKYVLKLYLQIKKKNTELIEIFGVMRMHDLFINSFVGKLQFDDRIVILPQKAD